MDDYRHRLKISLLLCCQLLPNSFNDWGILDSTPHRHPTHILSPNYCHRMCVCHRVNSQKSLKLAFIDTDLCCQHVANCFNDWGIFGSTPHPLPSNVYFCKNRHAQIAHIQVYTHRLEISLVSCTQLLIITRPALATSQNHYHLLCMCVAIGRQQSLKGSIVHMESLTAILQMQHWVQSTVSSVCHPRTKRVRERETGTDRQS